MPGRNARSNFSVEFSGQIVGSNSWPELLGQIYGSNFSSMRPQVRAGETAGTAGTRWHPLARLTRLAPGKRKAAQGSARLGLAWLAVS